MGKQLIAYFSVTGTTKKAAEALAAATGAVVFAIEPAVPYTHADLNWTDRNCRWFAEFRDSAFRPQIAGHVTNMPEYDTIYLGFPIWGYREPRIVDTFLEQYDFDGKTIILFATSGADGFGKTLRHVTGILAAKHPQARTTVQESTVLVGHPTTEFRDGRIVVGELDKGELRAWIGSLGF